MTYTIKIRDGHHIVDMAPETNELVMAFQEFGEGLLRLREAMDKVLGDIDARINHIREDE